jgi:hypothetical protein
MISDQLARLLPRCHVMSPAELAAPLLAGPCVDDDTIAASVGRDGRIDTVVVSGQGELQRRTGVRYRHPRWKMLITYLAGLVHTPDTGTRMLLLGSWGLLLILAGDWTQS